MTPLVSTCTTGDHSAPRRRAIENKLSNRVRSKSYLQRECSYIHADYTEEEEEEEEEDEKEEEEEEEEEDGEH